MRITGTLLRVEVAPSPARGMAGGVDVRVTIAVDERAAIAAAQAPSYAPHRDLGKLIEVRDAEALEAGQGIRPAERPRTLTPEKAITYANELEEERDAWRRRAERLEDRLRQTQAQLELATARAERITDQQIRAIFPPEHPLHQTVRDDTVIERVARRLDPALIVSATVRNHLGAIQVDQLPADHPLRRSAEEAERRNPAMVVDLEPKRDPLGQTRFDLLEVDGDDKERE